MTDKLNSAPLHFRFAQWVNDPRNSLKWHQEIFAWVDKYTGSGPREVKDNSSAFVRGGESKSEAQENESQSEMTGQSDGGLYFQ